MTKRPNINEAQAARIAELREVQGLSHRAIAAELGVSLGSVSWHCLINGVERFGKIGKFRPAPTAAQSVRRGNHFVRPFTAADDAKLLELEAEGLNPCQIGKRMNPPRQPNSIRGRLATLARHEAAAEEQAAQS